MYETKWKDRIDVVDLQPVIKELSKYKETLELKYSGIDFEADTMFGVPLKMECDLATQIGIELDKEAKANSQLTSYTLYKTGQDVIKKMVEENEITEEVGNILGDHVPNIARNVANSEFGRAVWCYKETYKRIRAI